MLSSRPTQDSARPLPAYPNTAVHWLPAIRNGNVLSLLAANDGPFRGLGKKTAMYAANHNLARLDDAYGIPVGRMYDKMTQISAAKGQPAPASSPDRPPRRWTWSAGYPWDKPRRSSAHSRIPVCRRRP